MPQHFEWPVGVGTSCRSLQVVPYKSKLQWSRRVEINAWTRVLASPVDNDLRTSCNCWRWKNAEQHMTSVLSRETFCLKTEMRPRPSWDWAIELWRPRQDQVVQKTSLAFTVCMCLSGWAQPLEHSDSEKNIPIQFSLSNLFFWFRKKYSDSIRFSKTNLFFDSIRFSISLAYRLLSFAMLFDVNSTPSSWVTLTTSQRHRTMSWHMIIDQANAAAESNGRIFNKMNLWIDSNRKSECSNSRCRVIDSTLQHFTLVFPVQSCIRIERTSSVWVVGM